MTRKEIFDRIVAGLSLLIFSPLLLLIALLIRIKMNDGPVIFRQQRIGLQGQPFVLYKFRTMVVCHHGGSVSINGESRITPLGTFLRKYKLDELPELWNVLKGDMSLVGPRPDVAGYADKLKGEDRKILEMRPGITGPASIKYFNEEYLLSKAKDPIRYNDEIIFPDKVKINLNYYRTHSFSGDLLIIIKTILRIKTE